MADGTRMHRVTLQPAVPSDDDLLYAVFASTRELEMQLLAWPRERRDALLRMQFEAQERQIGGGHASVERSIVLVDGRPVGRLYVSRDEACVHLLDIALLPEHRRRGIGTALITWLQAEAAAGGVPLRLHVARTNPAARLYQRLGFRPAGGDAVYAAMEWTALTAEAAG